MSLFELVKDFNQLAPDMQVSTILTLLFIAQRGQCNQRDIEVELGMTNAAASRNVSYWTDMKNRDQIGFGFVQRIEDKRDRRYKILSLTPEGEAWLNKMRGESNGKAKG
jgi:DNA-binding MarR family transcriptional regulator